MFRIERVPPAACGQPDSEGACGGGDSGVRLLTVDAPPMNSLTVAAARAFEGVVAELEKDGAMRALVVTGAGRAFSAGGDYGFIEDRIAGDVGDNARVLARFYTTFLALRRLPVPVVAAINGAAVGGGAGLAMAADMRLAASDARISFNFVK